jgi:hypothetical protein
MAVDDDGLRATPLLPLPPDLVLDPRVYPSGEARRALLRALVLRAWELGGEDDDAESRDLRAS